MNISDSTPKATANKQNLKLGGVGEWGGGEGGSQPIPKLLQGTHKHKHRLVYKLTLPAQDQGDIKVDNRIYHELSLYASRESEKLHC